MGTWHDGLTDEQIQQLKDNKIPMGLCEEWMRSALMEMGNEDLDSRQWYSRSGWLNETTSTSHPDWVFRLDPSWQRPAKQGRWEYCNITKDFSETEWCFDYVDHARVLDNAFSMVGFGGIEFEEWPGTWFMSLTAKMQRNDSAIGCMTEDQGIPATPRRVRFWTEG